MNQHIIIGRMGKDPEVKNLDSGKTVANFSVATSTKYKDKQSGEKKELTQWHNIVLWGQPAEFAAKYLHKGDLVCVVGEVRTRSWDQEGVTRYTTETVGQTIQGLSTAGAKDQSAGGQAKTAPAKGGFKPQANKSHEAPPVEEEPEWMRE